MGRTHNITISAFDLDRLESQLSAAEEEIEELKTQLGDAKATADLWIQKAKQADEAAADLITVLANARRHWREETEEQARLLGMSAERECDLRGELERERALADRLAASINEVWDDYLDNGAVSHEIIDDALAAWKEVRSE